MKNFFPDYMYKINTFNIFTL